MTQVRLEDYSPTSLPVSIIMPFAPASPQSLISFVANVAKDKTCCTSGVSPSKTHRLRCFQWKQASSRIGVEIQLIAHPPLQENLTTILGKRTCLAVEIGLEDPPFVTAQTKIAERSKKLEDG
jgi:hypothetical protein